MRDTLPIKKQHGQNIESQLADHEALGWAFFGYWKMFLILLQRLLKDQNKIKNTVRGLICLNTCVAKELIAKIAFFL